ncbi:hypothetical protein K443DRAFT_97581 [Laccaria amethystina LaAM-08-1]|uniref:Unplaced genomic scaffold K443scaffold_63, whole genome shotgun sequence n=1 Tax=Laccaria amethystina LaAM-08-1 TaxID=1095629 RepID=A0A0C9Y1Y8_9AGAR|nr:hypothetical protein K443DRAFT_97581 [Laccaria amethystina LaAM-08-1]
MPLHLRSYNFTVYYRLYIKDGPIRSNNPIYADNPFISRTLPKFITPPRNALSVKKHLCKIEGLSGPTGSTLFESLSSKTAAEESFRLAVRGYSGPGASEDDPMVLVVGVEDAEKRSASTAQSDGSPEAVLPEPCYGTLLSPLRLLYDEVGVLASKMSFNSKDSSVGRIETLSIPPPQTVSSLSFQVTKAEGFVTRTVQLYQDIDGEVPMTDNDHLPLQAEAYPGHLENEPITIVCGQESSGKAEAQVVTPLSAVDSSLLVRITGKVTFDPDETVLADWLPFEEGEVMYTDGIKTSGFIRGHSYPHSGYIAMNSAGRKGCESLVLNS